MPKLFLAFVLVVTASCRYSPSDSDTDATIRTSTLRGWLTLEGREDSIHRDHSGAKVELLGTRLSGYTDAQGYFEIAGIPNGSYTILMSAPGFDTAAKEGSVILAPYGKVVTDMLEPATSQSIVLDSISALVPYYTFVYARSSGSYPILMFFGRTREVDARWENHVLSQSKSIDQFSGATGTIVLHSTLQYPYVPPGKTGFRSGDSVYAVAYTGSYQVLDTATRSYRWMNLRNKSNVIGFKIP
jgi:hypothetical protein